jgi:hypothetical protein
MFAEGTTNGAIVAGVHFTLKSGAWRLDRVHSGQYLDFRRQHWKRSHQRSCRLFRARLR